MTPLGPCLSFETMAAQLSVTGELVAVTALRIGAGRDTSPDAPDLPVMRDPSGRPFIPGSSLKGAVRSKIEALVRGLVGDGHTSKFACLVTDEASWCVTRDARRDLFPDVKPDGFDDAGATEMLLASTCLVCRVFGSPWFAGKLGFADLALLPSGRGDSGSVWPHSPTQTRHGVAIDRDTGTASDHMLFQYEVVPAGSRFALEIRGENLTDTELGVALAALQLLCVGDVLIGGATTRGLGRVRTGEDLRVQLVNPCTSVEAMVDWLFAAEDAAALTPSDRKSYVEQAFNTIAAAGEQADA